MNVNKLRACMRFLTVKYWKRKLVQRKIRVCEKHWNEKLMGLRPMTTGNNEVQNFNK